MASGRPDDHRDMSHVRDALLVLEEPSLEVRMATHVRSPCLKRSSVAAHIYIFYSCHLWLQWNRLQQDLNLEVKNTHHLSVTWVSEEWVFSICKFLVCSRHGALLTGDSQTSILFRPCVSDCINKIQWDVINYQCLCGLLAKPQLFMFYCQTNDANKTASENWCIHMIWGSGPPFIMKPLEIHFRAWCPVLYGKPSVRQLRYTKGYQRDTLFWS